MEEKNMKLDKSFAILFAAALMLPLTSCLKEQADVFETPSSQRMQDYLENVRTLLTENEDGWILSYYPGSSSATCYMVVKFEKQQVTAYGESDPAKAVVSSYKLATDDGAVLSFDTYNSVLHYYATADDKHYQARGGDFEFDIIGASPERIVLRGKRSRNICYLDPMDKGANATAFLNDMLAAKKAFAIVAFDGEVSGGLVEGFLDSASNTLSIGRKGAVSSELVNARYMIVPGANGATAAIHINEPFTFQGVTFQDFEYFEDPADAQKGTLKGSGVTFNKIIPEGYVPYEQYIGKWTFYWYTDGRSFPVELVAFEQGASFKLKGLSESFEPVLGYNAARGQLTWNAQAVGQSGAITVWLAAWDLNSGGSLVWDEAAGLIGSAVDNTVKALEVIWEDNGESDITVDSWLLWGVDASGNSAGKFDSWQMASGSYQLPYIQSMVKVVE